MSHKNSVLRVSVGEQFLAAAEAAAKAAAEKTTKARAPKEPSVQHSSGKKDAGGGGGGGGAVKTPTQFSIPEIVRLDISKVLPSAEKIEIAKSRLRQAADAATQQRAEVKLYLRNLIDPMRENIEALFEIFGKDEKEQILDEFEVAEIRLRTWFDKYLNDSNVATSDAAKVAFAGANLAKIREMKDRPAWVRNILLKLEEVGFLVSNYNGEVKYLGLRFCLARLHEYVVEEANKTFNDLINVLGEAKTFLAEQNKAEIAKLSAIEAKGKRLSAHDLVHGDINGLRLVNIPDEKDGQRFYPGGRAVISARGRGQQRSLFIVAVGHKLHGLFEKKELAKAFVPASALIMNGGQVPKGCLALPFFLIRRALDVIRAEDEETQRQTNSARVAATLLANYQEQADQGPGLTVIAPTLQLDGTVKSWNVFGPIIMGTGRRNREREVLCTVIYPFFLLEEKDGQYRVSAHPGPDLVPANVFAGSTEFRKGVEFPGEIGKMIAANRSRIAKIATVATSPVAKLGATAENTAVTQTITARKKGGPKAAAGKTKKSVKTKK